jgi:hypothetical protein
MEGGSDMKVTKFKTCICYTCVKTFHYLGIARHRAMHRDKKEDCKITYANGETLIHRYNPLLPLKD